MVLIAPQGPTPGHDESSSGRGVFEGDKASEDAQRFRDYLDDDEVAAWEAGLGSDDEGAAERDSAVFPVEREMSSEGGSILDAEDIDHASAGR